MNSKDEPVDGWKIIGVMVAAILVTLFIMAMGEILFRQTDVMIMELTEVRAGVVVDRGGLPQWAGHLNYTSGRLCVGGRLRVLRKSGSAFGWFPTWYLLEAIEDSDD